MIRVGINGFGRIGRAFFRINLIHKKYEIVAINEIDPDINNAAYLLKFDSTYGKLNSNKISTGENTLIVDDEAISVYSEHDIDKVPWDKHNVDIVIDSSGISRNIELGSGMIQNKKVKKIIVTHSPSKGVDLTLMIGVNEKKYDPEKHHIVSSSICDANAVAPFYNIMNNAFGVEIGEITTLHPWLSYQNLLDGNLKSVSSPGHYWEDYALGRSSVNNLIPKATTLVPAIERVLPGSFDSLYAMSFRTPSSIVSAAEGSLILKKETSLEKVKAVIHQYALEYPDVLLMENKSIVSIDYLCNENAAVIDERWLNLLKGKVLKFVLWYDNEWGYTKRVYNLADFLLSHKTN